jgi:hypothetical protein
MRAQDIIRAVLDIIDNADQTTTATVDVMPNEPGEQTSRFKQIYAMLAQRGQPAPYSNSPRDAISNVKSVTTLAGGGVNGSKHPADIRIKDPRGFE